MAERTAGTHNPVTKLSEKTKERIQSEPDENGEESSFHPFDRWLQSELRVLKGDPEVDTLSPEIVELAAKLQEKLGRADSRDRKPNDDRSDKD